MSLECNWTFLLNQKPTDKSSDENAAKSYVLQLISFLVSHGWSYDGSCNSVTIDAVNNITTPADIVEAGSGQARSWIVLKGPIGMVAGLDGTYLGDQSRLWLTLDFMPNSPTTTLGMMSLYSTTKPTGGTTTSPPSSPTTIGVAGNTTFEQRTVIYYGYALASGVYYHFAITDKGHFWSAITGVRANEVQFVIALFPLTNVKKVYGKDYPYAVAFYQDYYTTGTAAPSIPSDYVLKYYGYLGTIPTAGSYSCITPRFNGDYYGNNISSPLDFNGNLQVFRVGIQPPGNFGVIGYIADFLFIGNAYLPNKTMNFEGDRCSFFRWMFPVDKLMKG